MNKITSTQNQKIKDLVRLLEKPAERRKQNLVVIEGEREITFAVKAGFAIQSVYWCPLVTEETEFEKFLSETGLNSEIVTEINDSVLEKIAWREGSQGLVAVAEAKNLELSAVQLPDNPFVIVLESVEKPGNLGAILRTADAAGVDLVMICDSKTDVFNPNTIRSSVGCIFTMQIAVCSSAEAVQWLHEKNIRTFAATLKAEKFYHEIDFTAPSAIVMGTESDGLSEFWHSSANEMIKIPMAGKIDSLNVSTSTAVLVFEAMRQRGIYKK